MRAYYQEALRMLTLDRKCITTGWVAMAEVHCGQPEGSSLLSIAACSERVTMQEVPNRDFEDSYSLHGSVFEPKTCDLLSPCIPDMYVLPTVLSRRMHIAPHMSGTVAHSVKGLPQLPHRHTFKAVFRRARPGLFSTPCSTV